MNLFSFRNIRTFGPAILVSFLGFFIGYFEKTNEELSTISKEQIKLSYQVADFMKTASQVDGQLKSLSAKVDNIITQTNKNTSDIEKITIRIDYLEGKGVNTVHKQ